MDILEFLGDLALPQLLEGALQAAAEGPLKLVTSPIAGMVRRSLIDNEAAIDRALRQAARDSWRSLEIALAGRSWWRDLLAGADTRAFAAEVRAFLDSLPPGTLPADDAPAFRAACLAELRAARAAGRLADDPAEPRAGPAPTGAIARRAESYARLNGPTDRLRAKWAALEGLSARFAEWGYPHLADLLARRPGDGSEPLPAVTMRFFFRRAVEEDERLHRGLTWATWEAVTDDLKRGLAGVADLQRRHGEALGRSLTGLSEAVYAVLERQRAEAELADRRHRELLAELRRLGRTAPIAPESPALPPPEPTPPARFALDKPAERPAPGDPPSIPATPASALLGPAFRSAAEPAEPSAPSTPIAGDRPAETTGRERLLSPIFLSEG
jgi:hypothetical protein